MTSKTMLKLRYFLLAVNLVAVSVQGADPCDVPGKVRLILPDVIYSVPGVETNIYFDNVVLIVNPENYIFDVVCERGVHESNRWTFTPSKTDCGDHKIVLDVRDQDNNVIARACSLVRVIPREAGVNTAINCLMIGDSLTHVGIYPKRVYELCQSPENPKLTLVGSRGPNGDANSCPVKFEGYGGWTAEAFAARFTGIAHTGDYKKCGSPFIYVNSEGRPTLDFGKYCAEFNKGSGPDIVTILLGCNDVFAATDSDIESAIDRMLKNYDILIQMIHDLRKETKIGVILPMPPAASQDAFGKNYKCGQTRWQFKRNQHRLLERMISKYGGRESRNLYIVPAYVNLDTRDNFPKEKNHLCNGVHPAEQGYNQIGEAVYCWIKSVCASKN
jgi:lysophospholipase L1-like esterase